MTIRKVVRDNAEFIDELLRIIRRKLTESETKPDNDEISLMIENEFFSNSKFRYVNISDINIVIDSVKKRIFSHYGVISKLLIDPSINEIMINGPDYIYVEQNHKLKLYDDVFTSEKELEELIRMFASDVHREINEANPIVDARLSSGYRVNGVLKNIALNGPILTIRKFSEDEITLEDMVSYNTLSQECADLLSNFVKAGYNIFISGGTSSGKTTFLNALSYSIDNSERVIVIEDSAELKISHLKNIVHMECRNANSVGKGEVTMDKLIKTSLRMRPDRIIVGEVRGGEVVDMIQAMNTGHDGSMSTGHGNSIKGMLNRLETMYTMDSQVTISSIRSQIANAVDIFVHLRRDRMGKRKVVEVAELIGVKENIYELNYLFVTGKNDELVRTDNKILDTERLERLGIKPNS